MRAIQAAGVPIVGMSFPDINNKATWRTNPPELQAQAQPTIDAFDPNDPAWARAEAEAKAAAFVASPQGQATLLFYLRHQFGGQEPTQADLAEARAALMEAYRDATA